MQGCWCHGFSPVRLAANVASACFTTELTEQVSRGLPSLKSRLLKQVFDCVGYVLHVRTMLLWFYATSTCSC